MAGLLILTAGTAASDYAERLRVHLGSRFSVVDPAETETTWQVGVVLLVVGPEASYPDLIVSRLLTALRNRTPVLALLVDGAQLDTAAMPQSLKDLQRVPALSVFTAQWERGASEVMRRLERLLFGEPRRAMRGRRPQAAEAPPPGGADLERAAGSEPPVHAAPPYSMPASPSVSSTAPAPPAPGPGSLDAPSAPPAPAEPVLLGASAPRSARPGTELTARFVAYVKESEEEVRSLLSKLSPRSETHLGLHTCRWQPGTEVTVRLAARGLQIAPAEQTFVWDGRRSLVEFDVEVPDDAAPGTLVLKFDASVDGVVVARLRLDLEIARDAVATGEQVAQGIAARTAFASYSSQDRPRVLDRLAAVRISAGLDIFLDCLSLRPGEQWKPELERQIRERDLFLLFWSKGAAESSWVKWEWETALQQRGEDAIQIHPLEMGVAPPEKLQHLHFGDPFITIRAASQPG